MAASVDSSTILSDDWLPFNIMCKLILIQCVLSEKLIVGQVLIFSNKTLNSYYVFPTEMNVRLNQRDYSIPNSV